MILKGLKATFTAMARITCWAFLTLSIWLTMYFQASPLVAAWPLASTKNTTNVAVTGSISNQSSVTIFLMSSQVTPNHGTERMAPPFFTNNTRVAHATGKPFGRFTGRIWVNGTTTYGLPIATGPSSGSAAGTPSFSTSIPSLKFDTMSATPSSRASTYRLPVVAGPSSGSPIGTPSLSASMPSLKFNTTSVIPSSRASAYGLSKVTGSSGGSATGTSSFSTFTSLLKINVTSAAPSSRSSVSLVKVDITSSSTKLRSIEAAPSSLPVICLNTTVTTLSRAPLSSGSTSEGNAMSKPYRSSSSIVSSGIDKTATTSLAPLLTSAQSSQALSTAVPTVKSAVQSNTQRQSSVTSRQSEIPSSQTATTATTSNLAEAQKTAAKEKPTISVSSSSDGSYYSYSDLQHEHDRKVAIIAGSLIGAVGTAGAGIFGPRLWRNFLKSATNSFFGAFDRPWGIPYQSPTPPGKPATPPGEEVPPPAEPESPQGGPAASPNGAVPPPGEPVTPQGGVVPPPAEPVSPQGAPAVSPNGAMPPPGEPVTPLGKPGTPPGEVVPPPAEPVSPQGGPVSSPNGAVTSPAESVTPPGEPMVPSAGMIEASEALASIENWIGAIESYNALNPGAVDPRIIEVIDRSDVIPASMSFPPSSPDTLAEEPLAPPAATLPKGAIVTFGGEVVYYGKSGDLSLLPTIPEEGPPPHTHNPAPPPPPTLGDNFPSPYRPGAASDDSFNSRPGEDFDYDSDADSSDQDSDPLEWAEIFDDFFDPPKGKRDISAHLQRGVLAVGQVERGLAG